MADRHPVDEVLPPGQLLGYGLQHVLAMYAGAVAVPLIVGQALGLDQKQLVYLINADLFTCGLATLLQTLGAGPFGVRLPVIQGVTFAAVAPMILIGRHAGLPAIYGAVIAAGVVTVLAAGIFSRLLRFFPPVVTGTTITLIGLSLMPVAARWAGGGDPAAPTFAGPRNLLLAAAVLVTIVALHRLLRGVWRNLAVLLGIVAGTAAALLLGIADLSGVQKAPVLGITTPLAFGLPRFDPASVLSMSVVMMVVMVETTGDLVALGELVDRPLTREDLARGLRADGLSTMLGGVLNAFPYTAYAQNVGLVALTRVRSRFVVATAGALLVLLGLFPKMGALVAAIPAPVLGGAGLVMFGSVAVSGMRTLARVDLHRQENALVVAVGLGVGLLPLAAPGFYHRFSPGVRVFLESGITVGSLTAVLLHAVLRPREPAPEP